MIVRIRWEYGKKGNYNRVRHADIICDNENEALLAAKEKRVFNWQWIDSFEDTVKEDYNNFIILGKGQIKYANYPLKKSNKAQ